MAQNHLVEGFREALAHIEKDRATGPLVTNMMAKCRKLLEGTKLKATYPVAKLFGNWVLHTELTSDKAAIEIIEQVNDFVVGLIHGAGGGAFGPEITRRLKLADLRLDLLAICKAFHVAQQPIADKSSWVAIQETLLGELCGSRIALTSTIQAALLKRYPTAHWLVTGFEIMLHRALEWVIFSQLRLPDCC
jgi:hypothetical protein